jgi:hypothetical protein
MKRRNNPVDFDESDYCSLLPSGRKSEQLKTAVRHRLQIDYEDEKEDEDDRNKKVVGATGFEWLTV